MVSEDQFHRSFFNSLVTKTGLISSFYLFESRKQGVATIEQCTKCIFIFSSNHSSIFQVVVTLQI